MNAKDTNATVLHNITVLARTHKHLNDNLIKANDDQTREAYEELTRALQNAIRAEANRTATR